MTDTTTLPIPPDTLLIITALLGIALLSYLVFLLMPTERDPKRGNPLTRVNDSLGFRVESKLTAALLALVMLIYTAIFAFAAIIALRALGGILFLPLPEAISPSQTRTGLAFGTLLAAILGAPFIIWRSWVAQKTAAIAEESLFNDKINAAATDLAARRQVTRVPTDENGEPVLKDGAQIILTESEDDLVTRAAAIDRLEGLAIEAMDRGDYAPAQRIARMLSIYVQELSLTYPPQNPPKSGDPGTLSDWASFLAPARPDLQRAAQSLGRINPRDEVQRGLFNPANIDLHNCNLQGFDFSHQNYQGANLLGASLQGANFRYAGLDSANMEGADLTRANFYGAKLRNANLNGAEMHMTNLGMAELTNASLFRAQLKDAKFFRTGLQGAFADWADVNGASLFKADLRWASLVGANLQGADLEQAFLEGADLSRVQMSEDTDITEADFRGVAIRLVDEIALARLRPHKSWIIFSAETLPRNAPLHWVKLGKHSTHDDFITQWRAWAATLDPPVTIAPDYRP